MEIRYTDDIPPQVLFSPALTASSAFPLLGTLFGPASPFAALDRISAAIDREAASLMRQAEMLANAPAFATNRPIEAALGNLPLGTESYSMMSTLSGNGVCSRASRSPRRPTAANRGRVAQFRQLRNDPGLLQARLGHRRCPRRRTDPTLSRPMHTAPRSTPACCVRRPGSTDLDHHRSKGPGSRVPFAFGAQPGLFGLDRVAAPLPGSDPTDNRPEMA